MTTSGEDKKACEWRTATMRSPEEEEREFDGVGESMMHDSSDRSDDSTASTTMSQLEYSHGFEDYSEITLREGSNVRVNREESIREEKVLRAESAARDSRTCEEESVGSFFSGRQSKCFAERFPREYEREIKEYGNKGAGYNVAALERMKQFNYCHERVASESQPSVAIEAPLANRFPERTDPDRRDLECIVYESGSSRMRRPQFLNRFEFPPHHTFNNHPRRTPQQSQQQIKSFTIDAILAHRNNHRDRGQQQQQQQHQQQQQQQQMRKRAAATTTAATTATATTALRQECEDFRGKNGGGRFCQDGNGSGKAKRVRTIFTPEQLERLEGEFARQQYMVGPERLYLAHALRLTEAQVKVWFQNRRIKWRKVNHEQQCKAVSEHRQRLPMEINEDEMSNDVNWCVGDVEPNNRSSPSDRLTSVVKS